MAKEVNENYFSIIIPLFNKEEYVHRTIESILNQSYQNFEIIVVNDGSSDGGENVVSKIKDQRIKLISQLNQGVSIARNNGASNSQYDLLTFLDADDTWEKTFLYKLDCLVNRFPNAGLYGLNNYFHYSNGNKTWIDYSVLFNGLNYGVIDDYFKIFSKYGKSPFSNSSCCFSKNKYFQVGGYIPGVKITEDSDLWCRMALKYQVVFDNHPVANYFLEIPNNTRTMIEFKDYKVSETLQDLLKKDYIPKKYYHSVKNLIAFQQLSLVKRAILTGNTAFARKKMFDLRIFGYYPLSLLTYFLISFLPLELLNHMRTSIGKIR